MSSTMAANFILNGYTFSETRKITKKKLNFSVPNGKSLLNYSTD